MDSDDSSHWDQGELCAGQSVSGKCGGPNGVWDANANVFLVTHVLYTGHATESTATCNNCVVSPLQGTTISFWPPTSSAPLAESGGTVTGTIQYADINLNYPAKAGLLAGHVGEQRPPAFSSAGTPSIQLKYPVDPVNCPPFVDTLGMDVTPLQTCDAGTVPDDAGNPVGSIICEPLTSITTFSGGSASCQYQLTNSNTQDAGLKQFSVSATLDVLSNNDSQSYNFSAL